jgi:biotin-dependent carboxylase-like uncharacterized protein
VNGALRAMAPGPHVTIQDMGRRGWRRFGVSGAGAMDPLALAAANVLVGNSPDTAALEFAHVGGALEVAAESCRIAVTGGDFALSADGEPLACWQSHTLRRGQCICVGGTAEAVWGYLAVAGGLNVRPQLGSRATHLRSRLGGIGGRCLLQGDVQPLRVARVPYGCERRIAPIGSASGPIRVVLGPQDDFFSAETIAAFLGSTYRVSYRADRMGTWLDGPQLRHVNGYNVLSDGLVRGCIQVPGSGQPVVLLMDCQTIGGYPKLATIVTYDLPRFVQIKPGREVRFEAIDIETAQRLYCRYRETIERIGRRVQEIAGSAARVSWVPGY